MRKFLYWASSIGVGALFGFFALLPASYAAFPKRGDDPGPHLQYGGTPIELHFDAPGANVTKVYVDGTPCIIVSFGNGDKSSGTVNNAVLGLSCNWTPR